MTFTVTYRGADGALREEAVEAASRAECFAQMKARGIVPVSVKEGASLGERASRPFRSRAKTGPRNAQDARCPSGGGKPKSSIFNLKSSIILAAVLAVAGGAWWWLAAREDAHPTEPKAVKDVKDIKDAKVVKDIKDVKVVKDVKDLNVPKNDSSSLKSADQQPARMHLGRRVISSEVITNGDVIVENLRTEDGKLHSIVSDAAPPVFANPADALLANLPPGDGTSSAPPPPAVSDLEKKFAESLKKEIKILDTDTDDIRAMKQAVMETRAELKRLIDSGQTVAQVLAQHQELANENARVRSNAMAELKQILDSGDIDGAKEYKRKINVALQQMGIAELSIPVTDAEREARAEQRRARRQARRKADAASGTMPE